MGKNNKKAKFDKELIYELYILKQLSTNQISKQLNCVTSFVNYLLKRYEIPIRSKKDSVRLWFSMNESPSKGIKKPWLSEAMTGENHFFFGKKRPDMSIRFSGSGNPMYQRPVTEETRRLISIAGKGRKVSDATKKLISLSQLGKKTSSNTKIKLSKLAIERFKNPENHPRWIGGKSTINGLVRRSETYNIWRTNIFIRDNFKCIFCDSIKDLCVDHIKPFAIIIESNNIISLEEANNCNELWDQNNGRTLCHCCHAKTETYGNKTRVLLKNLRVHKKSNILDNNI